MSNQIVTIDPKQFGLEESKAANIAAQFQPMLDKMVELEKEYNEVINLPIEATETAKKAKELRLKYVKVRTGTAAIHKEQKEFYLAGGRFVDGWKNAQLFASQGIESKLEEIEKYAENLEKKRIADLQAARELELLPYNVENISQLNLGIMSEAVWNNFLTGTIANYNAKIEAEKKAEEERIETARLEAERLEQQRLENERLKKEAAEREAAILEERKRIEAERQAERIAQEKVLAEQRAKADAKRKVIEEQARKEAAERAKIQAELEAKKAAELKAEQEKQAAIEAELSKGDAEKMQSLFVDLNALKNKYQFKSKKHQTLYLSINELIDKTVTYGKSKC
jgi:hypothetical protein